jgi:uncharacterized protein (DUF111 family)
MKLLIDPRGGIAGDMFTAALISAGADYSYMHGALTKAAGKLGAVTISLNKTDDRSNQLSIELTTNDNHLGGKQARRILEEVFYELDVKEVYQDFGFQILSILLEAEKVAHADGRFPHLHHHHHHDHDETTYLHEAQDIIIDITGAVCGLQNLNVSPYACLLSPISVGGGTVTFSHGELEVPAPATSIILKDHHIPWTHGPVQQELCTPTGSSIVAALDGWVTDKKLKDFEVLRTGQSRGSKILDIPPLKIYLAKEL